MWVNSVGWVGGALIVWAECLIVLVEPIWPSPLCAEIMWVEPPYTLCPLSSDSSDEESDEDTSD